MINFHWKVAISWSWRIATQAGCLRIYLTGEGEFDWKTLLKALRQQFVTFGVAEEFASDFGPQMKYEVLQQFLKQWGVFHRVSSAYFPRSNSRAELAVKAGKRLLKDNMGPKGDIDTDNFYSPLLHYRNTAHQDTSPLLK